MLDALGGDEFVGDVLDDTGLAAYDEDFEAIMVVEMHMEHRDDDLVVIVLNTWQITP